MSQKLIMWYIFSSNLTSVNAVENTLKTIMAHALRVNPTNPMWLRTQADIYFGM
jgi:hypothetical protein